MPSPREARTMHGNSCAMSMGIENQATVGERQSTVTRIMQFGDASLQYDR